nr:hypothetical protein [Tanacetum cinerariifolium]
MTYVHISLGLALHRQMASADNSSVPAAVAAPRAIDSAGLPSLNPSSEETTLQGFIPSNLYHLNQSFDTLTKLTKNHSLENAISVLSRPVSQEVNYKDMPFGATLMQMTIQFHWWETSYKDGKVTYSFPRSRQSQRDLPRDNPLVSVEVL